MRQSNDETWDFLARRWPGIETLLVLKSGRCEHCCGTGWLLADDAIGVNVRARRARQSMTQEGLAEGMNISPQYLCDLELGRRAWSLDLLQRCLAALGEGGEG